MILHFPYPFNSEVEARQTQRIDTLFSHPVTKKIAFTLDEYLNEIDSIEQEAIKVRCLVSEEQRLLRAVEEELTTLGKALVLACRLDHDDVKSLPYSQGKDAIDITISCDTYHTPIALLFSLVKHLKSHAHNVRVVETSLARSIPKRHLHLNQDVCAIGLQFHDDADAASLRSIISDLERWLEGYQDKV